MVKVVWVSSGNSPNARNHDQWERSGNASKEFREQWERRSHPTLNAGPTDRKHGHKKIRSFRDMAGYGTENAESQLDGVQDK